jgi:uncharacterized protein (DUF1015 family)
LKSNILSKNSQIKSLEEENNRYNTNRDNLIDKINNKSKKLSLLLKLVDELKNNVDEDMNSLKEDKMIID